MFQQVLEIAVQILAAEQVVHLAFLKRKLAHVCLGMTAVILTCTLHKDK